MASSPDILCACSILQRKRSLSDHFSCIGSDNVDSKNTICLSIRQELHKTVGVQVRLRTGVGRERECADLVLYARFFELRLVLAYPCDFRVRVHDGGNGAVVDVAVAFCDVFDRCDGLLLGFVGEHGTESAVANYADVRQLGAVFGVDNEAAAVIGFEANVFKAETLGVRTATDGDKDDVCFELNQESQYVWVEECW